MGKHPLLTEAELRERMAALPEWRVEDGKWIVRRRLFPTFMDAVRYVNRVAAIAEEMNHHPFVALDYRKVTLKLTTWNSGGLTALDIDSAIAYDGVGAGASASAVANSGADAEASGDAGESKNEGER
ncbi:4a-hydroxytetrahydrobiopterin dehydratase [Cohnella suwonensis]|uniref:4a-hydroxytetrahydrobiopterin dehydratase n=1 Tax=Cohnella suwonensis TaxID=696072 RepID=A0ABW0LZW5_9BACL